MQRGVYFYYFLALLQFSYTQGLFMTVSDPLPLTALLICALI